MPKIKISRSTIEKIKQPLDGQKIYWDSALMGFGLRVTKGRRSFIVQKRVNGKPIRITIGSHPQVKPEQARKMAQTELGRMAQGINPNAAKLEARAQNVTLGHSIDAFFTTRSLKPKTAYNYRSLIDVCFKDWKRRVLTTITKDMVQRRHIKIGAKHGKPYANFAMRVLRSIFNFAAGQYEDSQGRSLIPENPVRRLSQVRAWYKVKRRDDYIKSNELPAFFEALDGLGSETMRDYFITLLFSGLRRSEAASLKWEQVDFKAQTLTILDTKNDEKLTLPLSDHLEKLLKRRHESQVNDFVFPGGGVSGHLMEPKRAFDQVRKKMEIQITVHGLRRSFINYADSLDLSAYAIKALVNHSTAGDVTAAHYLVHNVERLRKPMQKITDFILLNAKKKDQGKVIELRP